MDKLKNMWSEIVGNRLYVLHNGKIIYKRWVDKAGNKVQPSVLFNEKWPNEQITD